MSTRKPDRFDRLCAERVLESADHHFLSAAEAAVLMREEHREVLALVEDEKVSGETGTEGDLAYNQACDDILAKLKARAQ